MNISTPQYKGFNLPGLRSRGLDRESGPRRLPGFSWLGDTPRHHLVALIGEFVGTFLFLFFAFTATQVANMSALATNATGPEPAVLLYISLAFGFSLAVNVWVFFRISGGLFNPAVSLVLEFKSCLTRLGNSRSLLGRCRRLDQRTHCLHRSDTWRYCSLRRCLWSLSWSFTRSNRSQFFTKNFSRPRSIHRDVSYRSTDFHNVRCCCALRHLC